MAATTLPITAYQRKYTSSNYDEFGAHGIALDGNVANSWDEDMAPALRKKLEEESERLERRLHQHDVQQDQGQQYLIDHAHQSRQKVKPGRRREVLQDGLGSDDLIPSEWATGSSAQFLAISPRSKMKLEEKARSVSTNQYPTEHHHSMWQHSNAATYLAPHSISQSPSSASGSPPISLVRDSPSPVSPSGSQSVTQAREKARKLAKERELQGFASQLQSGTQDGDYFGEDGTSLQVRQDERDSQENRNTSSPVAQKLDRSHQIEDQTLPAHELHQAASKTSLKDNHFNKAALATSNSMPRSMNEEANSQDVRRIKGAARLTPDFGDREVLQESTWNQQEVTSTRKNNPVKGSPVQSVGNNTSTSQDILDAFGPLGGIPKKKKPYCWNDEAEEVSNMANSRSVSNPWDEELLPTVKRRLAQERMLAGLGQDDDEQLVDTWDRHGLPLTKRVVSSKNKTREGRDEGDSSFALTPSASPSKIKESTPAKKDIMTEEEAQRMTRLHEQLDLSLQHNSMSTCNVQQILYERQHEEGREGVERVVEQDAEQVEMTERQHNPSITQQQQQQQQSKEQSENDANAHDRQRPDWAMKDPNKKQIESLSTDNKDRPNVQNMAGEDAGCCKCIVM